jgi:hypothetical protein
LRGRARGQAQGSGRRSHRTIPWLAWSLCALSLTFVIVWASFRFLNSPTPTGINQTPLIFEIWGLLLFVLFAVVGALVASRQPKNTIGWIFCAIGLSFTFSVASGQYAIYAIVSNPGSLPGGGTAVWLEAFLTGEISIAMFALILLLFSDGKPFSRPWRAVLWLDLIAAVLLGAGSFRPGPMQTSSLNVANPFGMEEVGALLNALFYVGLYLALAGTIAGAVSLMVRYRRSQAEERQQIKWFAFAGIIMCAVTAAGPFFWSLPPSPGLNWIWPALFLSAASTLPVATGIAMLKYRLYDIDLVINRALVYGSLTAMLAAVYFGGVATTETIFRTLTGQEQQPPPTVVVSTLIIAALFNPLRRRIQGFVDRRFYRSKYDAIKTLEAFSATLRDETDLDALSKDLTGVVRETMQPAHLSLWLRADMPSGRGQADQQPTLSAKARGR